MKTKKLKEIILICTVFLIGCREHTKDSKNILRWCFFNDILSLDPSRCGDVMSWGLLKQIFEPLLSIDEKGNIIPCLAEKWSLAADNKTYTFFLKKNVRFHDGTLMKAKDVKESLERTCSFAVNSHVALQYLGDIEDTVEFNSNKTSHIKGIKIIDDYKIQIKLKKPTSYFLKKLTHCVTGVMGAGTRNKKEFLKPEDLIGTGPFKLKNYVPKQELELVSYADYHNVKINIDGINIKILPDPEQSLNYFKEGNIDLCDISFKQVKAIKNDPILQKIFKEIDSLAVTFIAFNVEDSLFSKKFFRQAISAAIDRDLIKEALDNTIVPSTTLIPKNILGHRSSANYNSFDVKKAQSLLKKSGIKNVSHLNLKLYTISHMPIFNSIAENIIMQLKSNLNINVTLQPLARGTFMEKKAKGELGMMLHPWAAVFMDPSNFLYDLLCSESKLNYFHYKNSKVDELLLAASEINDQTVRKNMYQQSEDIILDEAPIIPICFLKRLLLIKKRVKGIEYNPIEIKPFAKVYLQQ